MLPSAASRPLIKKGKSTIPLAHECGGYSVLDREFPEAAVGLSEDFVRKCYEESGLAIGSIHYGFWCGRKGTNFYQDVVLSVRK